MDYKSMKSRIVGHILVIATVLMLPYFLVSYQCFWDAKHIIYASATLLLYMCAFAFLLVMYIDDGVFYRIKKMKSDIDSIAESGNFRDRVLYFGPKDEIGALSRSLNAILDKTYSYQEEVSRVNDEYKHIAEDVPAFICRIKPDGTILSTNKYYCGKLRCEDCDINKYLCNYDYDDESSANLEEFIPKDYYYQFRKNCLKLTRDKPTFMITSPFVLCDEIVWLEWVVKGIFDVRGIVKEYQGVAIDITEKQRVKSKLEETRKIMDNIVANIPCGILWKSTDLRYDGCNEVAVRILNLHSSDDVKGKRMEDLDFCDLFRENGSKFTDADIAILNDYSSVINFTCEVPLKHYSRFYKVVKTPILSEKSELIGIMTLLEDVTERSIAESNLSRRLCYEKLISEISTNLVGNTDTDCGINTMLKRVGEFLKVDRSYVFMMDDNNGEAFSNTHEWCRAGVSTYKDSMQGMLSNEYQWWLSMMVGNQEINLDTVEDLKGVADKELEVLESHGVVSTLVIPIINGKLKGFLGFDSLTRRCWDEEQIYLLRVLANIIASLIR